MQWLRRSFITGFFVTVPLVISVAAFVWIFRLIDGFVGPFYDAWLQRMPQLGVVGVGEDVDAEPLLANEPVDRDHPVEASGVKVHLAPLVVLLEPCESVGAEVRLREAHRR